MASSGKKKNPSLRLFHEGFDEPFISKFKYYLSPNKLNFEGIRKGKLGKQGERKNFDNYPIYLQHTLFYDEEDFQRVRSF